MDYLSLKHVHMGCAAASGALFLLRGAWMLRASPALQQRWVKILPHLIDTALLASAIALKRGKTPAVRGAAFAGAVLVFAYIVAVAVSKQAWPL